VFLFSDESLQLHRYLKSRLHFRFKKIFLASPFYEPSYLTEKHPFGRFIFRAKDDCTDINIVVKEMDDTTLPVFEKLQKSGINCFFYPRLHTKLYVFETDSSLHSKYARTDSTAILGSANMTSRGWHLDSGPSNEELCIRLEGKQVGVALRYANTLMRKSTPFDIARRRPANRIKVRAKEA